VIVSFFYFILFYYDKFNKINIFLYFFFVDNHNKKLFHAVSNNDFGTVSDLLDSNMYDVNCFDDKQRTCLHVASSRGYAEIARLLLQYGSNPNLRDCVNNLPIHLAIIASHVPVVTLLLEAGTDIHSLDLNEKSVLHLAGTRLRWLVNDESNKTSPKLKVEAILVNILF
jgi:ankyrin repeat protein